MNTDLVMVKPEEGSTPKETSQAPKKVNVELESLLKQDFDLNSEELENLIDGYDLNEIMNTGKNPVYPE